MAFDVKGTIIIDDDRNIVGSNTYNGYIPVNPSRSILAGNGMIGGGALTADVNLYVRAGSGNIVNTTGIHVVGGLGLIANATGVHVLAGNGLVANNTSVNVVAGNSMVSNATGIHFTGNVNSFAARSVLAGNGLSGGGTLAADVTLAVTAGNGLIANSLGLHVAAGNGLNANSTLLYIGAGSGINVTSTTVAVDSTVVRTTGAQDITGVKTFGNTIVVDSANGVAPGLQLRNTDINRWFIGRTLSDDGLGGGSDLRILRYQDNGAAYATPPFYIARNDGLVTIPNGGGIGNLNATNLLTGTLPDARLATTIARSNITITAGNGLTGGGDLTANRTIAIVEGNGISANSTGVHVMSGNSIVSNATGVYFTGNTNAYFARSVIAGNGLIGGGTLAADRTINVGAGDGITVSTTNVAVDATVVRTTGAQDIAGNKTFLNAPYFDSANGFAMGHLLQTGGVHRWFIGKSATESANNGSDFEISRYNDAGIIIDTPLSIGRGTGFITMPNFVNIPNGSGIGNLNANNIILGTLPDARLAATIARSAITITAGNGLSGGGNLTANRTLTVGAGDGITVNATNVAVDATVVRTTGAQTIGGIKTFSSPIVGSAASMTAIPAGQLTGTIASARMTFAATIDAQTATDTTKVMNAARTKDAIDTFTPKYFTSTDLDVANSTTYNIAHGLPGVPDIVMVKLICKVATAGYSVGDIYVTGIGDSDSSGTVEGIGASLSATNITINTGVGGLGNLVVPGGTSAIFYPTHWRIRISAIKFP